MHWQTVSPTRFRLPEAALLAALAGHLCSPRAESQESLGSARWRVFEAYYLLLRDMFGDCVYYYTCRYPRVVVKV